MPWEEASQASPGGGSLLDKALEIDRLMTQGLIESTIATPLRGAGAQAPEFARQQIERLGRINQPLSPDATPEERAAFRTRRGVQHPDEATIEERQQQFRETALTPAAETPLYQAGEAASVSGRQFVGPKRAELPQLVQDIASAAGSVAGNIGVASIPGIGPGLMVAGATQQGSGEAAERAIKAGATERQIATASSLGSLPGATEFADALLPTLGSTGKALGLIRRVGLRALEGAFIEGGQEGLQQLIQNMIAQGVYKPDQDIMEDVKYNTLVGAIVGGATSAAIGGHGKERGEQVSTPQQVEESLRSLAGTPVQAPPPVEGFTVQDIFGPMEPEPPPAVVSPQPPMAVPPVAATPGEAATNPKPPSDVPSQMPPEVSQFIATNVGKLTVPEPQTSPAVALAREDDAAGVGPDAFRIDQLRREFGAAGLVEYVNERQRLNAEKLAPKGQEVFKAETGAQLKRLAQLLGPKLYGEPSNMTTVSVKEMFQNAFDAIKDMMAAGQKDGNININMDPEQRTLVMMDDGSGMNHQTLGTSFLQIAGTEKGAGDPSGSLGIAKMLFLFGSEALAVTTMKNGKVSKLVTTGKQLMEALNDPSRNPDITVSDPTAQDRKMFPRGHGTVVAIKIPESYKDASTGEVKPIAFQPSSFYHDVLNFSPLFRNINVKFNGQPVENIGNTFPAKAYTRLTNINFDWGTARIYAEKLEGRPGSYQDNMHILSNGLWQFSTKLPQDPQRPFGVAVPRTFYIDLKPSVKAEEPGYPFDLNRQKFSPTVQKDFDQIFRYMNLLYSKQKFANAVKNWGDTQYLSVDPEGNVRASDKIKVEPKVPPSVTPLAALDFNDPITVKDGQLIVSGRKIPELTIDDLKASKINLDEIRISQSEIDPNRVMLHDNVNVTLSGAIDVTIPLNPDPFDQKPFQPQPMVTSDGGYEVRSMVELGRERFGGRFDRFMHDIGAAFIHLRDVVAEVMNVSTFGSYEDMTKEAVGISFDIKYRGVSIRVPFAGFFVNPAHTEYRDTLRASIGIVGTMVHELAHHKVRDHDAEFPAEMQRIIIHLDTHPTFDFHSFKQGVVNVWSANDDIAKFLYEVIDDTAGTRYHSGKQFKEPGDEQARDGGALSELAAALPGAGSPRGAAEGLAPSAQLVGPEQGPTDVSVTSPAGDIAQWFRGLYIQSVAARRGTAAPGPAEGTAAVRPPTTAGEERGGAVHFEEIAALSGKSPDELQQLVQKLVSDPTVEKSFSLARQTRAGFDHLRLRINGRE